MYSSNDNGCTPSPCSLFLHPLLTHPCPHVYLLLSISVSLHLCSDIIFPNEATSISAFGSHPIVLNLHAPDHSAAIPLTLKVENKALVQVASAAKAMKNQAREEGKDAKDEKGKGKK